MTTPDDVALPAHETVDDAVSQSHPRGLMTLFFTEMWERFSYYGMRAILVLFMVDLVTSQPAGGLGMDDATATAIYGIYTAAVYIVALPGGWIADRVLGMQNSIWYGGIVIMMGHFTLAVPSEFTFYLGLTFIVLGTGLLKPTVSATVGELYPEGGARRDAGFTIYYMGINLGAFLGPLVVGYLGESETFGWHWGFAAAGVGMLAGLIQYRLTQHHLGEAGLYPGHAKEDPAEQAAFARKVWIGVGVFAAVVFGLLLAGYTDLLRFDAVAIAENTTYFIVALAVLYFLWIFTLGNLTKEEGHRVIVIIVLFLSTALFWAGFEQSGSSLNLFAERYTDRGFLGGFFDTGVHPASWYQSLNPLFILVLAPVYAWLWVALAKRYLEPSIPAKFALGLAIMGTGFLTMYFAVKVVAAGDQAMPMWLITTYLLHTMGELCLSPVGLSSITKLSPKRFTSQMMGIWFLGTALGNLIAGLLAGEASSADINDMPNVYMQIFLTSAGGGLLLLIFTKPIKKLMEGVR